MDSPLKRLKLEHLLLYDCVCACMCGVCVCVCARVCVRRINSYHIYNLISVFNIVKTLNING